MRRFLAKRGRRDEALALYTSFDNALPRHPIVRAAMETLEERQAPDASRDHPRRTARRSCSTASASSATPRATS